MLALECYIMFWLKVHDIDVTICFTNIASSTCKKFIHEINLCFNIFLANIIESFSFNRLYRNVYKTKKFLKRNAYERKVPEALLFHTGFKGKVLRK